MARNEKPDLGEIGHKTSFTGGEISAFSDYRSELEPVQSIIEKNPAGRIIGGPDQLF